MPFADIAQNIGDAIAGVDRNKAYIEGQQQRATYDKTQAETDYAMEQARVRRLEAERAEMAKEAAKRFEAAGAAPDFDPATANIADIALAGIDWNNPMSGRNQGQLYKQRELVGTPAGGMLGDTVVTDDLRNAAMEAMSPASALTSQRPRAPGAPQVVEDPNDPTQSIIIPGTGGDPITVNTPRGPQPARPAARPSSSPPPLGTAQQRNFDWLTGTLGVEENEALRLATNSDTDFGQVYEDARRIALNNFESEDAAHQAGLNAVEAVQGVTPQLLPNQPRGSEDDPIPVSSDAEFDALPSGAYMIDPQGNVRGPKP